MRSKCVYGLLCVTLVCGLLAMGCSGTGHGPSGRPSVTFEPAGGTFDAGKEPASAVIAINADGTVTFPDPPMKRGYAFTGWFIREMGGEPVTANTEFDSDTTVYAQWGDQRAHTSGEWNLGLPSLHRLFSDYFMVGNVMDTGMVGAHETALQNTIDIPELVAMYRHHYNAVTPENSFKPGNIWPQRDVPPDFTEHDRLVDWANDNGIYFFGHVLIWFSQSADWLAPSGVTREQARENMKLYIDTVAGHFRGRIPEWEVVNEVFPDSVNEADLQSRGWRGVLRSTPFLRAYANGADAFAGEDAGDYIYDAFVFARLADPDAVLYYNDFNEELPGKREAIALMIEELNGLWVVDPRNTPPLRGAPDRLLIEGMGMQSHFHAGQLERYGTERVRDSIRRFAQTGVKISLTEFDITARASPNDRDIPITPEEEALQARFYRELFEIYLDEHRHIDRVTFWGRDDYTHWRGGRHPGIFTGDARAKDAFFEIANTAWERTKNNE